MPSEACSRCGVPLAPEVTTGLCGRCSAAIDQETIENAASTEGSMTTDHRNARDEAVPEETLAADVAGLPPQLPDHAGRYQILGEVARGGMGAVLKAHDPDLDRTLAVKVMLRNDPQRPESAQRFLQEAKVNGQLQHPGVPPVHEVGQLADGRPFFAMKLIDGRTLTELLRSDRSAKRDLPRLLSIFEQVCQTIAYAHDRGIIHRDLKPQNIMVGAFGEVQVMDWGLAKNLRDASAPLDRADTVLEEQAFEAAVHHRAGDQDTDRPSRTQVGSVMGTPAYMSPEQAQGQIDQLDKQTDVFGLGAILCEMITGQPPYVGDTGGKVFALAQQGNLDDCFARLAAADADPELLDLARRCLAPDRAARPHDAGQVAEAVSVYLLGVQERLKVAELAKVEAQTRSQEEHRRRKLQLGWAGSVLALMLLVGGGSFWMVTERMERRSALAQSTAQIEVLRSRAARAPSDLAGWRETLAAVEQAIEAHKDLAHSSEGQQLEGQRAVVQAALENAERNQKLLDDLVKVRSDALSERDDRMMIEIRFEEAFSAVGIHMDLDTPVAIGRQITRDRPRQIVLSIVAALDDWATFRSESGAAEDRVAQLTAIAQEVDPDPWRRELRTLLAQPEKPARRVALTSLAASADLDRLPAASIDLLGVSLLAMRESDEAERVLRAGYVRHPRDVWLALHLAKVLDYQGRDDEAIPFYTAARALAPQAAHGFAHALDEIGRHEEALAVMRDVVRLRPGKTDDLSCLGGLLLEMGHAEEAQRALEQAQTGIEQRLRQRPDDVRVYRDLARVLSDRGKVDEATSAFEKALEWDTDFATLVNFGVHLRENGNPERAVKVYQQAIAADPGVYVKRSADAHSYLGAALEDLGRVNEAIEHYYQAVKVDPRDERSYRWLGRALLNVRRIDEAMDAYDKAIKADPTNELGPRFLGDALMRLEQYDKAAEAFQKAIDLNRNNPRVAQFYLNLGICRYKLEFRDAREGQLNMSSAIEAFQESARLAPTTEVFVWLGRALHADELYEQAVEAYDSAIRIDLNNDYAYFCRGNSLSRLGRTATAIESYSKSVTLRFSADQRSEQFAWLGRELLVGQRLEESFALFWKAIETDPANSALPAELSQVMCSAGMAWFTERRIDEAVDAFTKAIQLDAKNATAHCYLGHAYKWLGRFSESLDHFQQGHALGTQQADWSFPSADWVKEAERSVDLNDTLPGVLAGDVSPADAQQRAEYASLCYFKQQYVVASRLFAEAIDDESLDVQLAGNLRYQAARAAALAATGLGDGDSLDRDECEQLRKQAIDWLSVNRDELSKELAADADTNRAAVAEQLQAWRDEPDLSGIRDAGLLANLAAQERRVLEQFWADVDALSKSTEVPCR